jgi:predicted amidohydrolase YtcJ
MTIKQLIARAGLALLLSCLWLAGAGAEEQGKADVVLRNGKIYTADPARSIKQAIAFSGNTILVVGDDSDMEKLIGPATKVVNLGGKLVLPGLIDTHIHPIIGAVNGAKCSLAGVKATIDALKPVIQACLAKDTGGADEWFEAAQLDNYGFQATAKDLDTSRRKGRSRSTAMTDTRCGSTAAALSSLA